MKYLVILAIFLSAFVLKKDPYTQPHYEWKAYFEKWKVTGCIAIYDSKNDIYHIYNKDQFKQGFSPASTFKILNTLIGLETGVIPDENFVLKWDGKKRERPEWNMDTDLKTAYKNSTVWYYQELAKKVGYEKMKYWVEKAEYGNQNIEGGIDRFWLSGKLRISPEQQISFLRRIHDNNLPFSKRNINILKKIMIEKDTAGYVLRSKTGMNGDNKGHSSGWYVGYVERKDNTYFFATCIQTNSETPDFARSRKEITWEILLSLKIIQ